MCPKAHGWARPSFTVDDSLPESLDQGVFVARPKVARIHIPKQIFDTDAQMAFCENLCRNISRT